MNIHTDQIIESCIKVLLKVQREALEFLSEIAHEVSNWLGIARREPGLRDRKVSQIACSSARGADDSCKTL
jgi:hypothetical protein